MIEGPADPARLWLVRWTRLLARHRLLLSAVLVVLGLLFSFCSSRIIWQPDVLQFFSSESAELRNMRTAAQQTGIFNHLRFDVHFDNQQNENKLEAATHDLAQALEATKEYRQVWTGVDPNVLAAAYQQLVTQAPALLTDADRAEVLQRASGDFLAKRFAEVRARLADPDGEILAQQLRADPLDLSGLVSERMKGLAPGGKGAQGATLADGFLTARDAENQTHFMIVAEPFALASNQRASEKLLAATDAVIAQVKEKYPGLGVWLVGPHRGYVENTHRIIKDVTMVSLLGTLAVGLAIWLFFGRFWTALLCMIPPTIGVGLAMGLAGALHVTLPLILLGFTGLLCGSTTDYGIQIIARCRRLVAANAGIWNPDMPAVAARQMMGPITMSVVTSITGFAALGFSAAPGLAALGLFVAASTACIWLITFLILPAYMGQWVLGRTLTTQKNWQWLWRTGFAAFLVATGILFLHALRVQFSTDPRTLDGSSAQMISEQNSFFHVWGDMRNRAMVLVSKPTAEEALSTMEQINAYLQDQERDGLIEAATSTSALLPSDLTAHQRAIAWQNLWSPSNRATLKTSLTQAATANGFKPTSFAAYTDQLTNFKPAPPLERVKNSPAALFPGFLDLSDHGLKLATLVQMRTDRSTRLATGWGGELRLRFPDAVILSGNMLMFDATDRARAEGERFGPWCLLVILLPLWLYFRSFRAAWIAMLCLIVGFIWVLGSAQMFGGGLNLLSLVPVLFTLGVAVDYGIYATSDPAWRIGSGEKKQDRQAATFLCAMTTILGTGPLILAGHPAMRWLGITLVSGVLGGYLTSIFIVAPLTRWGYAQRLKAHGWLWKFFVRWMPTAALAAGTLVLAMPPYVEMRLKQELPEGVEDLPKQRPPLEQIDARRMTAGDSWMRWRETSAASGLWEMALKGDAPERGYAACVLAHPIDLRIENEMLDQLDYFLPQVPTRWLVLRAVAADMVTLPRFVRNEYQQEIYFGAVSEEDPHAYLAPSYPRILSYHALHDISQMLIDNPLIVPHTFACTGVISQPAYSAPAGGHLMLARNFDFEGGESFGRQKSITYVVPPKGAGIPFAHVAWPGLSGVVTGMNRERLAVFINAAATSDYRRIGTPTILMVRDILEHASTIEGAGAIIRGTQVFVSDIIVVGEGKTGRVRVFETSPDHMASYDVSGSAVVSNHLVTPTFEQDPVNTERKQEGTTLQRFGRARLLLDGMKGEVTVEKLAALLRDKKGPEGKDVGYGNRNAIDGLIACHSVIMDVTAGEMWVSTWPNAEGAFVGVDVGKMLDAASEGQADVDFTADASPPVIAADTIMTDGTWQSVVDGRLAGQRGQEALERKDGVAAMALAAEVVKKNPSFYWGHVLLGRAKLMSGDWTAAKMELEKAMQLEPPYAATQTAIKGLILQCDKD